MESLRWWLLAFATVDNLGVFKHPVVLEGRSAYQVYCCYSAPFLAMDLKWHRNPLRGEGHHRAMITLAQLAPAPAPNFGDQFSGAAGDIWATVTGAYTGAVLDHHLPDSKFSKGVGIANVIIAWYKTIMSVARQNITIEVENAPLVRTKNRSPGERRTAKAKVEIDFPKHDALKAIRAAANLSTLDLQLPDGGPVSGAKSP